MIKKLTLLSLMVSALSASAFASPKYYYFVVTEGEPSVSNLAKVFNLNMDPLYPAIVLHFVAQAHFALGDYQAAAKLLLERIARNPGTDSSRMLLAACYGHLGRADEARAAWQEMLRVNPDFSLAQRERVLPYKDAGDFQRIAEGLAKAGLP